MTQFLTDRTSQVWKALWVKLMISECQYIPLWCVIVQLYVKG